MAFKKLIINIQYKQSTFSYVTANSWRLGSEGNSPNLKSNSSDALFAYIWSYNSWSIYATSQEFLNI